MTHPTASLRELESNLVDINRPDLIPDVVNDFLIQWKEKQGGILTGISHISEKGWYIFAPALLDNMIVKYFPSEAT